MRSIEVIRAQNLSSSLSISPHTRPSKNDTRWTIQAVNARRGTDGRE